MGAVGDGRKPWEFMRVKTKGRAVRDHSESSETTVVNTTREMPRDYIYRLLRETELAYLEVADDPRPSAKRAASVLAEQLEELHDEVEDFLLYDDN